MGQEEGRALIEYFHTERAPGQSRPKGHREVEAVFLTGVSHHLQLALEGIWTLRAGEIVVNNFLPRLLFNIFLPPRLSEREFTLKYIVVSGRGVVSSL